MCGFWDLFRTKKNKKKVNVNSQEFHSLGSSLSQSAAQKTSLAVTQASSPSRLPTTDLTLVYELPNNEFQTEDHVIRSHGFEVKTEEIGKGAFSRVYKAIRLKDQSIVACKVMELGGRKGETQKIDAKNELFVLEKTCHPHIVKLFAHFVIKDRNRPKNRIFIFLQFAENNSLSKYLRTLQKGLEENVAKKLFAQILSAVSHMHDLGIAHRDLKLGNILLDKDMNVLVSDFGLSRVMFRLSKGGIVMNSQWIGTVPYMAPEILLIKIRSNQKYDPFPADVWALGVILHSMVNRAYPFGDDENTPQELIKNQLKFETTNVTLNRYTEPTPEYKSFLRKIFVFDSELRIKIKDLMEQNWIRNEIKIISEKIKAQNSTVFPPQED